MRKNNQLIVQTRIYLIKSQVKHLSYGFGHTFKNQQKKILWKHVFMLLRICCCYSDHYVLVLSRFYSVFILSFSFLSCLSTLVQQCGVPIAFSWYCVKKNTRVVLSLKCIGVCSFFLCVVFKKEHIEWRTCVTFSLFMGEKCAYFMCDTWYFNWKMHALILIILSK